MNPSTLREIFTAQFGRRLLAAALFALPFSGRAVASGTPGEAATASPAVSYQLVGVARFDGISYASIVDVQTGDRLLLASTARSEPGLVLTSVQTDDDPSGPSATIRENGVSITLGFDSPTSLNPSTTAPSAPSASATPSTPALTPVAPARSSLPQPPPGATLPLVFLEVDPQKMTLTAEQKATLDQLRQDFIGDLNGGTPPNTSAMASTPTSPPAENANGTNQNSASASTQYQNWLAAQDKSDATFRMLFGTQAFNAYTESASYPTGP